MNESKRIADQLRRAFEGNAWHGPAVWETLAGISSQQAARRPLHTAHSIWELVLHLSVWESVVRRKFAGETIGDLPAEEDWPPVTDQSEAAWRTALANLRTGNLELRDLISRLADKLLDQTVPGKDYSLYVMLHGVVQHDLYHAGQIAVLKKALS
jgi:uncharacterized damage-inducible protein DinB